MVSQRWSRWCLGVSVVSRWFFGALSVMSRFSKEVSGGVLVVYRLSLGGVSLLSLGCLGGVLVVSL